jgi:hypothetical protein
VTLLPELAGGAAGLGWVVGYLLYESRGMTTLIGATDVHVGWNGAIDTLTM